MMFLYLSIRVAKLQTCLSVYLRWAHRFAFKNNRSAASVDLRMLIHVVDLEDTDEAPGLVLQQSIIPSF
jgi:hypothetical protein